VGALVFKFTLDPQNPKNGLAPRAASPRCFGVRILGVGTADKGVGVMALAVVLPSDAMWLEQLPEEEKPPCPFSSNHTYASASALPNQVHVEYSSCCVDVWLGIQFVSIICADYSLFLLFNLPNHNFY
jgi:hypothetical protein